MTAGDLDPQAAAVLDELRRLAPPSAPASAGDAEWLATFRCQAALLRGFSGEVEPVEGIAHLVVRGPAGELPVRLYRPAAGRLPLLLHVHGGGGIAGSVDGHDPMLRALANRTGWLVAAPDYRLAPACRFPVQIEECHAALAAAARLPDIDPTRIVVAGDSIGATIATAVAMLVRDRGGPALAGQMLFYPNTDLRADAAWPSRRSEDGRVIGAADLERQVRLYVAADADRASPLASPILAELADLPPTFITTGERDPLRDEGDAYARALTDAGVATTHRRVDGMIHAFMQMAARIDAAAAVMHDVRRWLDAR